MEIDGLEQYKRFLAPFFGQGSDPMSNVSFEIVSIGNFYSGETSFIVLHACVLSSLANRRIEIVNSVTIDHTH